jgi:hypothetical protein
MPVDQISDHLFYAEKWSNTRHKIESVVMLLINFITPYFFMLTIKMNR